MSHLSKLKLKNFRSFPSDEWTEIDLSLISVLTGPNNSGKSSVIKAILLLEENLNAGSFDVLDFTTGQHGLDSFDYAINNKSASEFMSFAFDISRFDYPYDLLYSSRYGSGYLDEFSLPQPQNLSIELHYSNNGDGNGALRVFRVLYYEHLLFEVCKDVRNQHSMFINFSWLINDMKSDFVLGVEGKFADKDISLSPELYDCLTRRILEHISHLRIDKSLWDKEGDSFYGNYDDVSLFNINNSLIPFGKEYKEIADKEILSLFSQDEVVLFATELSSIGGETIRAFIEDRFNIYVHFEDLIRNWNKALINSIDSEYIPHNRAHPSRLFNMNDNQSLAQNLKRVVSLKLSKSKQTFLNKYIKIFNIGESVQLSRIKNTLEVIVKRGNREVDLVDLGTSSLWFLPIILSIVLIDSDDSNNWKEIKRYVRKHRIELTPEGRIRIKNWSNDYNQESPDLEEFKKRFFKKNEIYRYKSLIVEEPEMALHPNLQSQLAIMFVEASREFNIQFLIETHSEYLIRKLQSLLADGKVESSDYSIYYFSEGKKLAKIEIERLGNLVTSFGSGFFDESTTLKDELLKFQEKRSLEERLASFQNEYSTNVRCLILTEDTKNLGSPSQSPLRKVLQASGFNMDETRIDTYSTSSQIQVALGMAEQAERLPHIEKVIIHRDSDGEKEKRERELIGYVKKRGLKKTEIFVTRYNDLEGYFITGQHIHHLYPEFSLEQLEEIISEATSEVKEHSVRNLSQRFGDNEEVARSMFEMTPETYRHTKKMKAVINRLLSFKGKSLNIMQYSDFLRVYELELIAIDLWKT